MSDIVERLRRKVFRGPTMEAVHTKTLEWEAADTITRLTAENEKLGRDYQSARDAHDKVLAENERLKRSRDRYRVAWEEEKRRFTEARAALSGDKQ